MATDSPQRPLDSSNPLTRPPALIFGVPISDLTMAETLDTIEDLVALGRTTGRGHQIATVNADFLVRAIEHPEFRSVLQSCSLCLPDGWPAVLLPRWYGMSVRERIAGSDLVPLLAERAARHRWRLHLFGSSEQVASATERLLLQRYPGASISAEAGPPIRCADDVDAAMLDRLAAVDADVIGVALGNPKQEYFIRSHQARIGAPVMVGIGGSLDMLTGERRRAPRSMQRVGLEWAVRAAQEPRRLGPRYAHDIRALGPAVVRELRAVRRRRREPGLDIRIDGGRGVVTAVIGGPKPSTNTEARTAAEVVAGGSPLVVDAGEEQAINDIAAAQLVGLVAVARRHGRPLTFSHVKAELIEALAAMRLSPSMIGIPTADARRAGHLSGELDD